MQPLAQLKKELGIDTGKPKDDMKKLNEWKKSHKLTGVDNEVILRKGLHKK
jgi:hypothetical protein